MIARVYVQLPTEIYCLKDKSEKPLSARQGGYKVAVHWPTRSAAAEAGITSLKLSTASQMLLPAKDPKSTEEVMIDGQPTVACDLVQIDFVAMKLARHSGFGGTPTRAQTI